MVAEVAAVEAFAVLVAFQIKSKRKIYSEIPPMFPRGNQFICDVMWSLQECET